MLEEDGFASVIENGYSDGSCEEGNGEIHKNDVSVDDSRDISLLLTEVGESQQVSNRSEQEAEKAEDTEKVVDVRVVGYRDSGTRCCCPVCDVLCGHESWKGGSVRRI